MSKLYDSENVLLQDSLNVQLYDSSPFIEIDPVVNLSGQSKINVSLKGEAKTNITLMGEAKTNNYLSGNIDEPKE